MKKNIQLLLEGQEGYGMLVESDSGLLTYDITNDNKILFENIQNKTNRPTIFKDGHFFIDCKLQEADVLNRNGRIYPKSVLEKQIKVYQQLINDYAAINEADHPNELTISLSNVSHRIDSVWWQGNTLYGRLDIIVSDSFIESGLGWTIGDKIALYLQRKIKLGISSRGIGSVKKINGKDIVQDDFELICFDLVASPSTPNAYLFLETANIVQENDTKTKNFSQNTKKLDEKLQNIINQ
jgi:hypothetical protein